MLLGRIHATRDVVFQRVSQRGDVNMTSTFVVQFLVIDTYFEFRHLMTRISTRLPMTSFASPV